MLSPTYMTPSSAFSGSFTYGFREIPLMEDYELAMRMKRRGRSRAKPCTRKC